MFFRNSVGILAIASAIGTLYWLDPYVAAGVVVLAAIPVIGDFIAVLATVGLIAFNIWAVEATIYFAYQTAAPYCGWKQLPS